MPKHFELQGFVSSERYRSPSSRARDRDVPIRSRLTHSAHLRNQLDDLRPLFDEVRAESSEKDEPGLIIEFESFPDIELAFAGLSRERSGIELRNVRTVESTMFATVFVPDGKLSVFERLIDAYVEERTDARGHARDNRKLVDTIANIRAATLRSLWTDREAFPNDPYRPLWWEVWLPVRRERARVIADFRRHAFSAELQVARGELTFPERTVLLLYATAAQLQSSRSLLDVIAELRRARETAEFFVSLPAVEQPDWISNLLSRTTFAAEGADVPHICILDTGVNRGHPMLSPALASADQHTIEPGWGVNDRSGHGTNMAGLTLVGDLTHVLDSDDLIELPIRLEAVKLLDRDGGNRGESLHHGYLTRQAVALPEIAQPFRKRLFCIAISAGEGGSRGRPSAWSASVDGLAAGTDRNDASSRLIVAAAGNAADPSAYPDGNSGDSIHDPGQAWNALTVGAFTDLVRISDAGADAYAPLARAGGLSPYSTTSISWVPHWPLKPDVVFEGGNFATDGHLPSTLASLSLLTTDHEPTQRLFTTACATSASTALAAQMAAEIRFAYPHLRAETVRALIVHSANWSAEMRRMYLTARPALRREDYIRLVRHCGFGVPNLARARESLANSLSLISESALVPFERSERGSVRAREMNLHELPWPSSELLSLGDTEVELRVTLSYFVEPNPSSREQRSRYQYQSHGLRFDVRRPGENTHEFRLRINRAVEDDDETSSTGGSDSGWLLGKNARHRGSIHSDVWTGSAADLADRGVIGVFPATGWWKTRQGLRRWDSEAPYSLVVSIRTPATDVDLYAAIASQIGIVIGGDE